MEAFASFKLMEDSLSGLRSPSVARPVVKERRLATANAPTHPHRDLERTAKDHIRRLRNAKCVHAKVWDTIKKEIIEVRN